MCEKLRVTGRAQLVALSCQTGATATKPSRTLLAPADGYEPIMRDVGHDTRAGTFEEDRGAPIGGTRTKRNRKQTRIHTRFTGPCLRRAGASQGLRTACVGASNQSSDDQTTGPQQQRGFILHAPEQRPHMCENPTRDTEIRATRAPTGLRATG